MSIAGVVADGPVRLAAHIGHRWAGAAEDLDVPDTVRDILRRG